MDYPQQPCHRLQVPRQPAGSLRIYPAVNQRLCRHGNRYLYPLKIREQVLRFKLQLASSAHHRNRFCHDCLPLPLSPQQCRLLAGMRMAYFSTLLGWGFALLAALPEYLAPPVVGVARLRERVGKRFIDYVDCFSHLLLFFPITRDVGDFLRFRRLCRAPRGNPHPGMASTMIPNHLAWVIPGNSPLNRVPIASNWPQITSNSLVFSRSIGSFYFRAKNLEPIAESRSFTLPFVRLWIKREIGQSGQMGYRQRVCVNHQSRVT